VVVGEAAPVGDRESVSVGDTDRDRELVWVREWVADRVVVGTS
jgi:hypothetical protein